MRLGDVLGDLETAGELDDPEGTIMLSAFVIVKRIAPEWPAPRIAFVQTEDLSYDQVIGLLRDVTLKIEKDSLDSWSDE